MFQNRQHRVYIGSIAASSLVVAIFATLQIRLVLGLELQPVMYITPVVVGSIFGVFLAHTYILGKRLRVIANTDMLTGLYNRQWLNSRINECLENYRRYNTRLSVIMLDIDDFKKINDLHGHIVGDRVLVKLASIIKLSSRATDYCIRWGGEEFLILLPNTDIKGARTKAEYLRKAIEEIDFPVVGKLTCSFGVTELNSTELNQSMLINQADQAMYRAKQNGRNCVASLH